MDNYSKVRTFVETQNDRTDVNRCDYNCMGWALNIRQWLRPLDTYDAWDYNDANRYQYLDELLFDYANDEDAVRERFIGEEVTALKDVWGLRPATQEEINNEDIPLIAFREKIDFVYDYDNDCWYTYDTDFHFRKRINGIWTEKMGGGRITICEEPIESDYWDGGYDSDIYYFVKEL
jgi:hypothetical protein